MWTREDLKIRAKDQLRIKYWQAFAVTTLVAILGGSSGGINFNFNFGSVRNVFAGNQSGSWHGNPFQGDFSFSNPFDFMFAGHIILLVLFFTVLFGLFAIAFGIFVSPVVHVGGNRWFSRSRESQATPNIGQVFYLFRSGYYLKVVGSMFWMNLFLFLWGLLAVIPTVVVSVFAISRMIGLGLLHQSVITQQMLEQLMWEALPLAIFWVFGSMLLSIPSIIKSYSYRLTPWILGDNPQIGYKEALKLSMRMTSGHKFDMFVLDLSFIGWFLLGLILCGVGIFFVFPYYTAVQAELYATLRYQAVEKNLTSMEALGFMKVEQPM